MKAGGKLLSAFSGAWPSSAWLLVAANAVPLLLVLFSGWTLGELLALYWFESAIIGFFNIIKMLAAPSALPAGSVAFDGPSLLSFLGRLFLSAFFAVHFGGFMAGHAVFLIMMMKQFRLMGAETDMLAFLLGLKWAALALFVSHAYSFFVNYLPRERALSSAQVLMGQPYPRIIVMHVTIIIGMFLLLAVGHSSGILILFTALKTGVDLGSHLKERAKFSPAAA